MKWFLFLLVVCCACRQNKENHFDEALDLSTKKYDSMMKHQQHLDYTPHVDSFPAEYIKDNITGYYKNIATPAVSDFTEDNKPINDFFKRNVKRRDIIFLNTKGLGHSVWMDSLKNIRIDTFISGKTMIIQKNQLNNDSLIYLKIDGHKVQLNVVDNTNWTEALSINTASFRHLRFKGKEFYYFQAQVLNWHHGSIGNVIHHIIYSIKGNRLNLFYSCRFPQAIMYGDFDNDNFLDFVHFANDQFCTTVPSSNEFEVNIYSCDDKGKFVLQKDKKGKPYFIYGNSGEDYAQDSFNISSHYWPIKIK